MLIYNQAFDPYHCLFRMLQILTNIEDKSIEIKRLKILDYYLLFPEQLNYVKFPQGTVKRSKLIKETTYTHLENPQRIFFQLEDYQKQALKILLTHSLINKKSFEKGMVELEKSFLFTELYEKCKVVETPYDYILSILTNTLFQIELAGVNGLKNRTNLFGYDYDLN